MRIIRCWAFTVIGLALAQDDALTRHRNLGKAFYENPTTQMEAVEEFRKALELAPGSARDRLNYGLALLRAGKTEEGIRELEQVQRQDPKIPHTWFNLGIQYKKQGEAERAIAQFRRMIALVPDDAISHYNLAASLKLAGNTEEALKEFEAASRLDPRLAGPHFQLFNAYRAVGRKEDAARELATFQRIKKEQEGAALPEDLEWNLYAEVLEEIDAEPIAEPERRYTVRQLAGKVDAETAGAELLDADGDGRADVLVWSSAGLLLYRSGTGAVAGAFPPGPVVDAAAGDFDNDGSPDVAVVQPSAVVLFRNVKGKFVAQGKPVASGSYNAAIWLDYDHDYDLDLILLGKESRLLRNQGESGFADRSADFPFVAGEALHGAAVRTVPDTKGMDLAVSYRGRSGVLYRDQLGGVYKVGDLPAVAAGAARVAVADRNNDGVFELAGAERSTAVDADFDGDGDLDRFDAATLQYMENSTAAGSWITVRLKGVRNLKLAHHAEVEVKAGGLYAKRIYTGTPLTFWLGPHKEADTVRITWPNGLIQNEIRQAAGKAYVYEEAQRLSGSCPMIWTWNGSEFEYVTDVLGVAPLGAAAGDGSYFPVDHDEHVQIPRGALVERDGGFDIRLTEELSEVAYLDRVALIAVDHPAGVEVFTNDKFKAPPFPEFRLYGVERRVRPVAARQGGGDVLAAVLARDRVYAERYARDLNGVAEMHALELDFGAGVAEDNRAVLVLSGWVDWADGSTFLARAQEGKELRAPYLQVRDESGAWKTVIEDMGMPAGKPKTIVVDLTGKFLSRSREVRIVTNLAVYWDEVFLGENSAAPEARLTALRPAGDLRFRGFSRVIVHAERRQPEMFLYPDPAPFSMWNQTPGRYTRYGPVGELLAEGDDRFVIMGSGDELRLRFEAASLPRLARGWVRDFLLLVEGWAKDRDPNTAYSQTVEPLPFRNMSAYPYGPGEAHPDPEYHSRYNSRPALRPLRPLRPRIPGSVLR